MLISFWVLLSTLGSLAVEQNGYCMNIVSFLLEILGFSQVDSKFSDKLLLKGILLLGLSVIILIILKAVRTNV